jgi:ABC-type transport system involved in multi-copper enzyme maturation permease subunit
MKAVSQTIFLALTDLRRQLGSPHSAISFVGSILFVGILFWLLSGFAIDAFLNVAFLMMPMLILAPATAAIASDRETGYAGILFTYPVTSTRYYAAKFLALLLLLGVYLLLLIPFLALILLYAGMGWLGDIAKFAGWAILETSFVAALGLFLSASFGRRATVASAYIGFGLALLFVIGPWYIPYYLQSLPSETASWLLRFLHFSPVMAALDERGTATFVAENPLPAFVATLSVVLILVAFGLLVYRRFQSPEGWEVGRAKAVPIIALAVLLLLVVPALPGVSYGVNASSFSNSGCARQGVLQYCVSFQTGSPGDGFGYPSLGVPIEMRVAISVQNEDLAPVHLGRIALAWSSRFLDFNLTRKEFGPVDVPASSGLMLNANVTALLLRLASVTVFQGFPRMVAVPLELVVDGLRVEFPLAFALSVSGGPILSRDWIWVVVGLEVALVLGRRLIRRTRKARP